MPFLLKTATPTFQRVMNIPLGKIPNVLEYMNNIIFSDSLEELKKFTDHFKILKRQFKNSIRQDRS